MESTRNQKLVANSNIAEGRRWDSVRHTMLKGLGICLVHPPTRVHKHLISSLLFELFVTANSKHYHNLILIPNFETNILNTSTEANVVQLNLHNIYYYSPVY